MSEDKIGKWLLSRPRYVKVLIAAGSDACLCLISVWLAYYFRTGVFHQLHSGVVMAMAVSIALALPVFFTFRLYNAVFRYEGIEATFATIKAIAVYGLIYCTIFTLVGVEKVPRTLGFIQPILLGAGIGISRAVARVWLSGQYKMMWRTDHLPRSVIYGAGDAGRQLCAAIRSSAQSNVVAFLDDNKKLHGLFLEGIKIRDPEELSELIKKYDVKTVYLAIPSASITRRKEIIEKLSGLKVRVHTLPALSDIANGKIGLSSLREVSIEELLGREPVKPIPELIEKNIRDKVVLVTGAGGSIGSELCRQIVKAQPKTLLLVERSEFQLYSIHQELTEKSRAKPIEIVPLLADVQNYKRLVEIMHAWKVQTVYHAAAYKHVPMVEHNPLEGIRNNVFGTWNCAKAAKDCGVDVFTLISTDKAVRPTNVMGASKRLCELVLQAMAKENDDKGLQVGTDGHTLFTMVRFGNVLGSSGSVVPRFRKQIMDGGPVTLTHKDIIRYFMTIPEASQLVIQASALAKGGDVFLLDMGDPVKIADLARRMIELSGYSIKDDDNPDGDIAIEITGLRPGEKLYEELLIQNNPIGTAHPRIYRANERMIAPEILYANLNNLRVAMDELDRFKVLEIIKNCVVEFDNNQTISDWILIRKN